MVEDANALTERYATIIREAFEVYQFDRQTEDLIRFKIFKAAPASIDEAVKTLHSFAFEILENPYG